MASAEMDGLGLSNEEGHGQGMAFPNGPLTAFHS